MCKNILEMIVIFAIGFLIGPSAVFSERTCAEVQQLVANNLNLFQTEHVSPISHLNFNTGIIFQRLVYEDRYDKTVCVVKPGQTVPKVTVDGTVYALDEFNVSPVDPQTAELIISFTEIAAATDFPSSVDIVVPIILTENATDSRRNPWLTTDLRMLSSLPKKGSYRVNSIEWLLPLLKIPLGLEFPINIMKYFMTDCQIVPSYAVQDFFTINDEMI